MPPIGGGMLAPAALRMLGMNLAITAKALRAKLTAASRLLSNGLPQPIAVPIPVRQPIHPSALLRQQKRAGFSSSARWYSTHLDAAVRRFFSNTAANNGGGSSSSRGVRFIIDRASLPVSRTSRAVSRFAGRAPFASTLRPNLTGGALPRTAGGYAAPGAGRAGGARYFSHTPAAPAQVVQEVSQAMRAFWLSGQRARFDGTGPRGEARFRAVGAAEDAVLTRFGSGVSTFLHDAPGAFVDFRVSPTITALSPLGCVTAFPQRAGKKGSSASAAAAATLNAEGFLDVLSVDFARALKDLAAVMTDLKKLAALGDLPISLREHAESRGCVLRVRFPGVDAETVARLCDDVGVSRGVVGQDPGFDASVGAPLALRFPFAPDGGSGDGVEKTVTSPGGSLRSHDSQSDGEDIAAAFLLDEFGDGDMTNNPWLLSSGSSPGMEGYESLSPRLYNSSSGEHCSEDFEGLEGIYRFLEECDRARDRF